MRPGVIYGTEKEKKNSSQLFRCPVAIQEKTILKTCFWCIVTRVNPFIFDFP